MKKLFSVWLAVLLCLTGCTNEETVNAPVKKNSIQAGFEDNMSRLAVGEGNALIWSEGDAFEMFDAEGGGSSVWTLEGTGGEATGTFGTTDDVAEELKGAAFPASAVTSLEGNVLTMNLPSTLEYEAGVCNLPMWGACASMDEGVSFKHLGALLKIDFKEIPAGYNKLTVTADKPLAGTFTANVNQSEPVLKAAAQGTANSVQVSFDANEGKQGKMFYLPLPVGKYASIKVILSGDDNLPERTVAEWTNRTIVRKKVYLASLTYKTSSATTTAAIDTDLGETKTITLEMTEKVTDVTAPVTLPADAHKVGLNFAQVPATTSAKPLVIEESGQTEEAELSISIPASQEADSHLTLNVPNTTVTVESGNYKRIVATTAANTLVLGEGTKVEELVIKAGNVALDGAEVKKISRHADTDEIIYVFVKGTSTLAADALGEGVQEPPYLTFKAEASQMFYKYKSVTGMEYSVGGGVWTLYRDWTKVEFGGALGDLRLRNKNPKGTIETGTWGAPFYFENETPVAASGDILTLVDYENHKNADTSEAGFCAMFTECTVLTSAPELTVTNMRDNCYCYMFYGCTNLKEAPALPATTLSYECYRQMFMGCTGLEKAPELPATALAYRCYQEMFLGCTSLEKAPELPATTLAQECYDGMFSGCTGLTEAPALPATALADICYQEMFLGCTSLEKAPELPATTLAYRCYNQMFFGCTGLTEAPALPATTLVDGCYRQMFEGCSGLNEAPELPATTLTLAFNCYGRMFADCTSLTKAPELPATTLETGCYRQMFEGCTGLTEAPALPATNTAIACYEGMFKDCTSLTETPVLPAMVLLRDCYNGMFQNCSNLKEVTMLATYVGAADCLTNWLDGIASTGTFYKNSSVEDVSAYGIPEGWTVKNYGE